MTAARKRERQTLQFASRANVQVTIRQSTRSRDQSYGEEIETWSDLATVYAIYLPQSETEVYLDQSDQRKEMAKFIVQYRTDLDTQKRLMFDSKEYDILGVQQFAESKNYMVVSCERYSAGG